MEGEPVAEVRIGNLDVKTVVFVADVGGGLEPGFETVRVDLPLDHPEDLNPNLVIPILVGVGSFIISLFLYPIFIYTPLYAALGGFDNYGMELFEKSANISGPSKFITKPMLWFIKKTAKRSRLHNRFPLPGIELAEKERIELNQLGLERRKKN